MMLNESQTSELTLPVYPHELWFTFSSLHQSPCLHDKGGDLCSGRSGMPALETSREAGALPAVASGSSTDRSRGLCPGSASLTLSLARSFLLSRGWLQMLEPVTHAFIEMALLRQYLVTNLHGHMLDFSGASFAY